MYIARTGGDSVSAAKPQNRESGGSGTEGTVTHQGPGIRDQGSGDQGSGDQGKGPGRGRTLVALVVPWSHQGGPGRWDG